MGRSGLGCASLGWEGPCLGGQQKRTGTKNHAGYNKCSSLMYLIFPSPLLNYWMMKFGYSLGLREER